MRACVRAVEKGDDEQSNTMAMAFDVGNEIRQAAAKVCMYVAKSRLCVESNMMRGRTKQIDFDTTVHARVSSLAPRGARGFVFRRTRSDVRVHVCLSLFFLTYIIFRFTNHHHNTGEDEVLRSYVQHGIDERA